MASLSGEFQTDLGPPDVLELCVEALDAIGWEIDEVTERRIVATANGYGTAVTVDLREAGDGTDFRIAGSDEDDELAEEDLADVLDQARDAIGERIERAEAPEQEEEPASPWIIQPDPEPEPEPEREWEAEAEPETGAVVPLPAPASDSPRRPTDRPSSESWWDRNRRAVAIGILVFCVGGGIGAALSGGDGGGKTVKRAAGKSKGASQKAKTEVSTVTETQSVEAATTEKAPDSASTTTPAASSQGANPASPAAPATPRVAKCDPGYAPQCLDPNASDYDCLGQGDGPFYVDGPVTVVGNDRFKLDTSDHDGVACE